MQMGAVSQLVEPCVCGRFESWPGGSVNAAEGVRDRQRVGEDPAEQGKNPQVTNELHKWGEWI